MVRLKKGFGLMRRVVFGMMLTLMIAALVLTFYDVQPIESSFEFGTAGSWVWVRDTITGAWGEAVVGTGDAIYIAKRSSFHLYNSSDNSLTDLTAPPNPDSGDAFKTGTALAWDFGDYIYALYGAATVDSRRWFYRYNISANSWEALANTTAYQGEGDAMTWVATDNCIYATIGGEQRSTYFVRYDPSTNSWSNATADPPDGMGDGASLVWTNEDFLYALRGEDIETSPLYDFWRYNLTEDVWTPMADIPADSYGGGEGGVGDGGSLLYVGFWLPNQKDYIYALSGNQVDETRDNRTYRYTMSENKWERLEDLPFKVGHYVGCRLGYADGHIYAWQGTPNTWIGGGDDLAKYKLAPTPRTWIVDDDGPADFNTIQEAINAADPGDTILVHNGTYHEHVVVNKTLSLIGEHRNTTIIDGNNTGAVVHIWRSDNVTVSDFTMKNGVIGMDLYDSSYTVSRNTSLTSNQYNFRVSGDFLEHFTHDIDTSNTVDGRPIYYWVNQANKQVPVDAGYAAIVNCSNIVVKSLNVTNSWDGILFVSTRGSVVENVNISNNAQGIALYHSSNNTIEDAVITNNKGGIALFSCSNNNIIEDNNVTNNEDGICIGACCNNTVSRNTVVDSSYCGLFLEYSRQNIVTENCIVSNLYGINPCSSRGNIIYHNNFKDNTHQIHLHEGGLHESLDIWDNGYPSGGNYWSDYTEADACSGPHQNMTGSDGIVDARYTIDANNTDNYPLMSVFHSYRIDYVEPSHVYKVNLISNSTISDFAVGVWIEHPENRIIEFNVAGDFGIGFCRICIPHGLMAPPYNVTIDNGETPILYMNDKLYDNDTHRWMYFTYPHTTHQVTIIPELPSNMIVTMFMITSLITIIIAKKRRNSAA